MRDASMDDASGSLFSDIENRISGVGDKDDYDHDPYDDDDDEEMEHMTPMMKSRTTSTPKSTGGGRRKRTSEGTEETPKTTTSRRRRRDEEDAAAVVSKKADKEPTVPVLSKDEQLSVDHPETGYGSLLPGARVLAKWVDKTFYPGHVVNRDGLGRYKVKFLDGGIRDMPPPDVVPLAFVDVGRIVSSYQRYQHYQ